VASGERAIGCGVNKATSTGGFTDSGANASRCRANQKAAAPCNAAVIASTTPQRQARRPRPLGAGRVCVASEANTYDMAVGSIAS
jgi:hypothetical protein